MEAKEPKDGSQDPLLGGLAGLPAYPGSIPTLVEREVFLESRRRFLRRALVTALAIPPVATAAGLGYVGFFGEDPEERARRYRSPRMGESVVLGTHERYPYSRSALRIHAEEEVRLTPERFDYVAELCTIADNIADQVAVRMKNAHESDSVTEALRIAVESEEHLLQYASAIATELRHSGCFYHPEGSLANAVDPAHPRPKGAAYHLDCDLLCLIALHSASRHDIPFHAVVAPSHMYLGSPAFPELAIEMTAFRGEVTGVRLGRGLRMVPQWDACPTFSSSHDAQRAHWQFAREDLPRAFGFFQPMGESELQEAAIGSVLYEMADHTKNDGQKLRHVADVAWREGGRNLPGRMIPCAMYYVAWRMRQVAHEHWRQTGREEDRAYALQWAEWIQWFNASRFGQRVGNVHQQYDDMLTTNIRSGVQELPSQELLFGRRLWWPAH